MNKKGLCVISKWPVYSDLFAVKSYGARSEEIYSRRI